MALYAHIVDGVLESVGALPVTAKRLDTGQMVFGAELAARLTACGYYPLDVDLSTVTADPVKRAALVSGLAAAKTRQTKRAALQAAISSRTDLARSVNWDWIDNYCHPNVASINYVSGQSPNAGQNWLAPTAAVAADRLRLGESYAMVELVQLTVLVDLIADLVADLFDSRDIDPPADR